MASQQEDNVQQACGSSDPGGVAAKTQTLKLSPSPAPDAGFDKNEDEGGEAQQPRPGPVPARPESSPLRRRRHPGAFATPEEVQAAEEAADEQFDQYKPQRANHVESILDRQNRAIAAVLTRFREMVKAVTEPLPKQGAILEAARLNVLEMDTQTAAFIKEVKDLYILNREIKILWMQGPLDKPGGDHAQAASIAEKIVRVNDLYTKVQDMIVKQHVQEMKAQAEAAAVAGSSADDGGDGKKPAGGDEAMDETK
ncbi:hypothetical protein SLS62_001778 [Diatrype stigma]|uniref:Uncharacterized protein n=1 Tax=Diatrype stigma TaxID=117547 RepID=A0AAN9YW94_9PEZI